MPNRRRRRLSTATSAVAALAVVSPFAYSAISDMKPAPQPREFQSAAMVTDLPNELMSALSQGLSQFGINLPAMPSALTGSNAAAPTTLTAPGGLTSPMTSPGLGTATPGLGATSPLPAATTPALGATNPALAAAPGLNDPTLANPALTSPAPAPPGGPAGMPGLAAAPANPASNPALSPALSPTGALPGGLTTPPVTGVDPALAATTPLSNAAGLPNPGEVPISAPIGLDPAGTSLGGTSLGGTSLGVDPGLGLGAAPAAIGGGSGGLLSDLSSAAQQLGAGQAIDLLKGVVMPMITSAMKAPAAAVPAPPPPAG